MPDKPKVFRSATLAWIDALFSMSAMPLLTSVTIGVFAINQFVEFLITSKEPLMLVRLVLEALLALALNLFLTPFYLAIHRYIILGETTRRYTIDLKQPRFLLFFAWSAALQLVWAAGPAFSSNSSKPTLIAGVIIIIVSFVISIKLTLLFPAIAVDAAGATWRNSFQDTFGYFWRIVGIILLAHLPLFALATLFIAIGERDPIRWISAVTGTISTALLIAIASRLYIALGDHLNKPSAASF